MSELNGPLFMEAQALRAAARDILDPALGPLACFTGCGSVADCHHCGEIAGVRLVAGWLRKRADYIEALALGAIVEVEVIVETSPSGAFTFHFPEEFEDGVGAASGPSELLPAIAEVAESYSSPEREVRVTGIRMKMPNKGGD